ncbi:ACP S-malonyltransferase [Mycetocola reblochoni]|uniref:[acyl-carrier-protein] S-malonyltransferase n=1 Tax=Mycetocola reblochoni TaxID=331618 RepID=A0A3L6ZPV2_9MICO|nr:ACP S-malonyltransferase [Mycetocola reblochoni]RLP69868.1 ACP S-malonyltransferase [Mycetocola reblochoni]
MIVIVCPGQGSQKPGFLTPWLDLDGVGAALERYSEASGLDLTAHGTVSDEDTIRDTAVAQPLIVAAGLVTLNALRERISGPVDGFAGHSVGEITAAAAAGVLSEDDALGFVSTRARAMAAAAAAVPTGMSAVLGGDEATVLALVSELGLEPANFNGGGQIVVAGDLGALAQLAERAPRGTRVVPLQVAGAFHTRYMAPARDALATVRTSLTPHDPETRLWSNNHGAPVTSGTEFADLLVTQVASPVRWDRTMDSFVELGVTGLVELAPAGALTGLAKRAMRGVPTVAVRTPDDLDAAVELLSTTR